MKNVFVVFLLFLSVACVAQNEYEDLNFNSLESKKLTKSNVNNLVSFKLSFLMPSVGAEFRLAERFSLDLSGKFNAAIGFNGTSLNPRLMLFPFPVVHLEPKWNYNIKKRELKGKNVNHFSSNFLSLYSSYRIKVSPFTNHSLLIGPTWGIQRSIGGIGYFKLNTGLGFHYFINNFANQPYKLGLMPIVDVQLGVQF